MTGQDVLPEKGLLEKALWENKAVRKYWIFTIRQWVEKANWQLDKFHELSKKYSKILVRFEKVGKQKLNLNSNLDLIGVFSFQKNPFFCHYS